MHGFSIADGFVEISECLAEMIKYVANEPSTGLFYIQQHTQNAAPNLVSLENNVKEKSNETALHTEDSEDSITVIRSMKECGCSIADEMIKDINKSLALMSSKQPKRGLIQNPISGFQMGRTSSWRPNWGRGTQEEDAEMGGYFSTIVKSAKQKASDFKRVRFGSKELMETKGQELISYPNPSLAFADTEADELPLSSQAADVGVLKLEENLDDFKADKEAKLEEWLEGTAKQDSHREEIGDGV